MRRRNTRLLAISLVAPLVALFATIVVGEAPTPPATDAPSWFNSSFPREPDAIFHGLVKENWLENGDEARVEVSPRIVATASQGICGFTILDSGSASPSPFAIKQEVGSGGVGSGVGSGRADLLLRRRVDCETNKRFKIDIAATACGSNKRVKGTVYVDVVDENEWAPEFPQSSYTIDANEGRLYDKILQVKASDRDCSPDFGDVCGYEIETPGEPFHIDREGNLKNTEELDWNKKRNHILAVVAFDCAQRRGPQAMVNIIVNRVCRPALRGFNDRLIYAPGSGPQSLLGDHAHLDLCAEHACQVDKLTAYIRLETKHIGKGCDRDTYSIKSQRKLCHAHPGAVDLLPAPGRAGGQAWRSAGEEEREEDEEEREEGGGGEDEIYAFDGETNAVVIPQGKLDGESPLGNHFTISTWMKHQGLPGNLKTRVKNRNKNRETREEEEEEGKEEEEGEKRGRGSKGGRGGRHPAHKEQILCNADDHDMNRHHFSLFLTSGKLHFLLRQKAGEDQNIFKPAEWRWHLDQVDDGEWHHYAVNVDFPKVELFIDGRKLEVVEGRNPKIVDDWPLHKAKDPKTKTVVGACWHGGEQRMFQHFKGYLAGLTVLVGKSENPDVIQCLHNCKEGLDYLDMNKVPQHSKVTFNPDMTEVTLNSRNEEDFDRILRRVTYTNTRTYPTPGHRPVTVRTTVSCKNEKVVTIPDLRLFVQVASRDSPSIRLSATFDVSKPDFVVEKGVRVFPDLEIVARSNEEEARRLGLPANLRKLDSCVVEPRTPLDPATEKLRYPEHLMATLQLEPRLEQGQKLVIKGVEHPFNYQEVLRQIIFTSKTPQNKDSQSFTVHCSEQEGRFTSNSVTVQLNFVHEVRQHPAKTHVARGQMNVMSVREEDVREINLGGVKKPETGSKATASVLTLVGVAFAVIVFIFVVIRLRSSRGGATGNDAVDRGVIGGDDYHWVDELNIIVNPLEEQGKSGSLDDEDQESPLREDLSEDFSDSDRELDLEQGEGEEFSTDEDDDVPGVAVTSGRNVKELRSCRGLEWDDSTI